MSRILMVTGRTTLNKVFGAASPTKLAVVWLLALAISICATETAIAQSGKNSVSVSPNPVCFGSSVTVTVNDSCQYPNPTATVAGQTVTWTNINNGIYIGSVVPTTTGTNAVSVSDCTNFPDTDLLVVQLSSITVTGATSIDGTNYGTVMTPTNTNYVTITANVNTTNTNSVSSWFGWSGGGTVVATNPLQVQVSTASSAETTVTASACSSNFTANIWVLWSTLSILVAPPIPPNAPPFFPETQTLGVIAYDSGNEAEGQICVVATVTPTGANAVNGLNVGWQIIQNRMSHDFTNSAPDTYYYDTTWQPDGPNPPYDTTNLDASNNIYTIDNPSIGRASSLSTAETYNNFYDYLTWNGQTCSNTNNFWYWEGRWNSTNTPQVTFTNLGTGTINLPTTSFY
jgi:hypothetical protein